MKYTLYVSYAVYNCCQLTFGIHRLNIKAFKLSDYGLLILLKQTSNMDWIVLLKLILSGNEKLFQLSIHG